MAIEMFGIDEGELMAVSVDNSRIYFTYIFRTHKIKNNHFFLKKNKDKLIKNYFEFIFSKYLLLFLQIKINQKKKLFLKFF